MDKKTLFALTAKIFNTLKGIGIKPKIGVTTGIKRLPGSRNSFNTDLSKLEGGNPESLKKLIANDADFLPQATSDEIIQYNNNLEYLKSTYPETFAKPKVVTEAKTGIKTIVDDVNEQLQGKKSMETINPETGEVTIPKAPIRTASKNITEVIDEGIRKQAEMARMGLDPGNPDDYIKYEDMIKNREPKAGGGLINGIGTMFRKRRR
jgi:hypothetical protein